MEKKAYERQNEILNHLERNSKLSTRSLSEIFGVSEVTIRKDLMALRQQGLVSRTHGGVARVSPIQIEQSFADRRAIRLEDKQRIARVASALVRTGETIMLDISTTSYHLALQLREMKGLRVVTNSVPVIDALSRCSGIELIIIGGVLRTEINSIVGTLAMEMIATLHAEKAFMGTAGIVPHRGITDADFREVQVKQSMIKVSDELIVLTDSSKFGQQSFLSVAQLSECDRIVTDEGVPADYVDLCRSAGIKLDICPS
jgi:DeoR/GlpR family transcriptional regulator of sugar metabolism